MELVSFREVLYGKQKTQLYTFDSLWETFRPITKVGWNGDQFVIVDSEFKKDLFSSDYGFGDLEQRRICRVLTQETELGEYTTITDPVLFWKWCGTTDVKWMKDRPIVFASPCTDRDTWRKYLSYLQTRAKTVRRPFAGRLTRRLVPK